MSAQTEQDILREAAVVLFRDGKPDLASALVKRADAIDARLRQHSLIVSPELAARMLACLRLFLDAITPADDRAAHEAARAVVDDVHAALLEGKR